MVVGTENSELPEGFGPKVWAELEKHHKNIKSVPTESFLGLLHYQL